MKYILSGAPPKSDHVYTGPEQFPDLHKVASYTGQGQGPGGAVISQWWSFSLQFGIEDRTETSGVRENVAAEPVRRYVERPNRFHPPAEICLCYSTSPRYSTNTRTSWTTPGRARRLHMLQTKEEVLDIVEDVPSTSTREITSVPPDQPIILDKWGKQLNGTVGSP
ncbi:hypothetical protein NQ317_005468 [Molorchus minor]|uniref:Uncharacterized protein n=1 Tax=Molorchus minor TaxID=1323400 RepID=A0ABQ9IQH0_9CUCU|nr:hypothetical protein NQ317_005468 [Molorchus minor]